MNITRFREIEREASWIDKGGKLNRKGKASNSEESDGRIHSILIFRVHSGESLKLKLSERDGKRFLRDTI